MTSFVASLCYVVLLTAGCMPSHVVTSSQDLHSWCMDDVTDSYLATLTYVNSSTIGRQQLQTIVDDAFDRAGCRVLERTSAINISCSECLAVDDIYAVLQLSANANLNRAQYYQASTIITTFLYQLATNCDVSNQVQWDQLTYADFTDQLRSVSDITGSDHPAAANSSYMSGYQVESILRLMSENYIPGGKTEATDFTTRLTDTEMTCQFGHYTSFSSESVMLATGLQTPTAGIHEDELGLMSSILIGKLIAGACIVRVYDDAPVSSDFIQSVYDIYADDATSCRLTASGLERMMTDLGVAVTHDAHDHLTHAGESRRRRRREVVDPEAESVVYDVNKTCVPIDDILKSFGIDESLGIARTDFLNLCPAIIQQATVGCKYVAPTTGNNKPSAAEIYGYGTVSVFFVSIVSPLGLVIVRCRHSFFFKYLLILMLGLAVGSLVGDAFLHLIPQALGLHDHSEEESHDEGSGQIVVEMHVWKMLCACFSIWLFFNVQLCLQWIGNVMETRKARRQFIEPTEAVVIVSATPHNHDDHETGAAKGVVNRAANHTDSVDIESVVAMTSVDGKQVPSSSNSSTRKRSRSSTSLSSVNSDSGSTHVHAHSSVAWMITVGDGIHNFADGLAIGASYEISWRTGLSTTIAVFCHELPHEFGDVAVLLSAGWSPLKVGIFQLISASTAFIGLYVGISISEYSADAQAWIFVIGSGMFLFVALSDVIPELIEYFSMYRPLPVLLVSNTGIMIGFLTMMLLAVFEEAISIGA